MSATAKSLSQCTQECSNKVQHTSEYLPARTHTSQQHVTSECLTKGCGLHTLQMRTLESLFHCSNNLFRSSIIPVCQVKLHVSNPASPPSLRRFGSRVCLHYWSSRCFTQSNLHFARLLPVGGQWGITLIGALQELFRSSSWCVSTSTKQQLPVVWAFTLRTLKAAHTFLLASCFIKVN